MTTLRRFVPALLFLLAAPISSAPAKTDGPDREVIHRIKQEAFKKSQVMDHLFYMTDVYGPRLTNSPGFDEAARWVVEQAKQWGLEDVSLEKWGDFRTSSSRVGAPSAGVGPPATSPRTLSSLSTLR